MKKLLAIFTLFLSINSAEIQQSKFCSTGTDFDSSDQDSDNFSSPIKKRRGSRKSAKALARQRSAELQPVFLTPPRSVASAGSWSTQSSFQEAPLSNTSNMSIESGSKRKAEDQAVTDVLKQVSQINEDEVDDTTTEVIERALDIAHKKAVHKTPQRRAFTIYESIYTLLTGHSGSILTEIPFKLEADKLSYLMKMHKNVLSRMDQFWSDGKLLLHKLESAKFAKYLRKHNLETTFIDVKHIFDGDEKGGAHVYTKCDDERFQKEVIEPSSAANKKVHINRSNGVISGYKNARKASSIFPRHLSSIDIFGMLRGSDIFECGYGDRRLLKKDDLYIELYLQLNGRLIKSAFPIFSFVDLNNFNEHDRINIFVSDIQELDLDFFDLIANVNKALLSSVESKAATDNLPFRYFIGENDIIIDIAPILESQTDIKSGIYVQVNMDRLDPALLLRAKECYSNRHVRHLISPYSEEVSKITMHAALHVPPENAAAGIAKPPRVPRRPLFPPALDMMQAGPAE